MSLMTRPSPGLRPPSPGGRGISAEVSARRHLIEILLPPGEGARSADEGRVKPDSSPLAPALSAIPPVLNSATLHEDRRQNAEGRNPPVLFLPPAFCLLPFHRLSSEAVDSGGRRRARRRSDAQAR